VSDRNTKPNCILLVDDDRDWRALMRDAIFSTEASCDVREAADAHQAMRFLMRRDEYVDAPRPDLVFLDVEMPGASGQDVLRMLRSSADLKTIPVVMMTGLAGPEIQTGAVRDGADDYIVKPTDPEGLVEVVAAAVARWLRHIDDGRDESAGRRRVCKSPMADQSSLRRPRILVVEDDPDQRELINEILCMHFKDSDGHTIVGVGTAAEALKQDLELFDIVLLDYNLPDMPGLDLLEKILAKTSLPVIFVTGENVSAAAAEAIRKGAQDYVTKLGDYLFALPLVVEKNIRLHQIKCENERLQAKLELKNRQLEESLAKLRTMARTDHLTGLANRRRFGEILDSYYDDAVRYGHDLACCMCDLDDYKHLNDTLGHQVGDEVLTMAADVIRSSLRTSDVAARYGGDEFVLLLPHASVEFAVSVCERIRLELADRSGDCRKLCGPVTMSIGVASLDAHDPASGDTMVSMADQALYVAKDRGRDQIVPFHMIRETTRR